MPQLVLLQRPDGTGFFFDCTLSEQHSKKSTVTKFPVEQGASVADNVRPDPSGLTLRGIVGPAPMNPGLGQPESAFRVQQAYEDLLAMQDNPVLLTIVTTLKSYASMVITSSSVSRDSARGLILDIDLVFEQIKTATSLQIDLPEPKLPRGAPTRVDGRRKGEEVEAPTNVSLLRSAQQNAAKLTGGDAFFNIIEKAAGR